MLSHSLALISTCIDNNQAFIDSNLRGCESHSLEQVHALEESLRFLS
jgi:hypothetical protein